MYLILTRLVMWVTLCYNSSTVVGHIQFIFFRTYSVKRAVLLGVSASSRAVIALTQTSSNLSGGSRGRTCALLTNSQQRTVCCWHNRVVVLSSVSLPNDPSKAKETTLYDKQTKYKTSTKSTKCSI